MPRDKGIILCVKSSDHKAIVFLGLESFHDARNLSSVAAWTGARSMDIARAERSLSVAIWFESALCLQRRFS